MEIISPMINSEYKKKPILPTRITKYKLEQIAFHYISRFDSSSNSLRQVLRRRVLKSASYHNTDKNQGFFDVEKIIEKFNTSGFINDEKFAERHIIKMCNRGFSSKIMIKKLKQKGLSEKIIINALKKVYKEWENSDLSNAIRFARRKKITITSDNEREKNNWRKKSLAAFAQAGFDYETAKKVIEARDLDELQNDCSS